MDGSIRTTIEIADPGDCPVARVSAENDLTVPSVTRSTERNERGDLTEEFTVATDSIDQSTRVAAGLETGSKIFTDENRAVYRFSRDPDVTCVCACIEGFGWPVSDIHAFDGVLAVTCYVPSVDQLRLLISTLRDRFDGVHVKRLQHAGNAGTIVDDVPLEALGLTDRQREVLETAIEMGYFNYPRDANAGEVAEALDIARSTFSEHLAVGQRKLVGAVLESETGTMEA
ncbi:helix-turn-helix domain-containing protein [Natrialbaceae archaeon A-CW2]|uniref:helix-turn-helix domain-containing protein n=1 Tax=Natronosalvus amylolyticus TaxID=2961994 RepID=UPI0020C96634|nr:helix-turn-helix domain-containing protein [Natronosalvus amylolyticus]